MKTKFTTAILLITGLLLISVAAFCQTMNASGNWDDATKWTAANIGDAINENVTLSGNTSPTVRSGFNYIIGNLSSSGDNNITIASGGSLTLGASGNSKSLTMTGTTPKITVSGTLTVWGNVTFTNKADWVVWGTVIIKGNLILNGGADLDVKNGALLQIEGSLIGANDTDVTVNGSGGMVKVFQNVSVGTSSNLNGGGSFQYGGNCTSGSNFCNNATYNGTLPVKLLYLRANEEGEGIKLTWATATEKNFDRFVIERSSNGQNFQAIGEQKGSGNSLTSKTYSFTDAMPFIGKNYYRLKSIDFDLSFEYSSVVVADFEGTGNISLYPNPVVGSAINITTNFQFEKGDKIEIIDNLGVKLHETIISEISNTLTVENDLKSGSYILRFTGANKFSKLIRFTKK